MLFWGCRDGVRMIGAMPLWAPRRDRDEAVIGDVAMPGKTNCDRSRNRYVAQKPTAGTRAAAAHSDASGRPSPVMGAGAGYEGRTSIHLPKGSFMLDRA